jgi:hypothetical protein
MSLDEGGSWDSLSAFLCLGGKHWIELKVFFNNKGVDFYFAYPDNRAPSTYGRLNLEFAWQPAVFSFSEFAKVRSQVHLAIGADANEPLEEKILGVQGGSPNASLKGEAYYYFV